MIIVISVTQKAYLPTIQKVAGSIPAVEQRGNSGETSRAQLLLKVFLPGEYIRVMCPREGLLQLLELEASEGGAVPPLLSLRGEVIRIVAVCGP